MIALLALVLIGAAVLQISVLTYPAYSPEPVVIGKAEYATVELPAVEPFRSPHAILVLDVSGSMPTSDPERSEFEAARQFYTVFRDLSKETLLRGDSAHIALIVFSTIAQVVDWDGSGQAWLSVDDAHTVQFQEAVAHYLGSAGKDPRTGRDTDYLAALDEVIRLDRSLPSPPAVLFLTDGKNEPHPLFSPASTSEERRAQYPQLWDRNRGLLEAIAAGHYRFVNGKTGEAFDRLKAGIKVLKPSIRQVAASRDAIRSSLAELLQQRFFLSSRQPAVPLMWQPVFLGTEEAAEARELLGAGESPFVAVHDPRELPATFIHTLSMWLHLASREVRSGAGRLQVPADTQAFALTVETKGSGDRFVLRSGSREATLAGANGAWAGVAAGGGDWEVQTNAGAIQSGRIYLKPRYEWVLHAPRSQTIARVDEPVKVELYLMSLDTGGTVAADSVYPNLPSSLPLVVRAGGGGSLHSSMVRSPGRDAAYTVEFPAPGTAIAVDVEVDLSPLEEAGITISVPKLAQRIELRPNVRVVVTTNDGRESAITLRNAPTEASRIQRIWERLRGERR
jgi:hypothetical protein